MAEPRRPAAPAIPLWYGHVPRSIRGHTATGLVLMALAFGGFGTWAFTAPLAAAVIAQGNFVAAGENKTVQHLEGGMVERIEVREGDRVAAGEVLLHLDGIRAAADERALFLDRTRLGAKVARLRAQYEGEEAPRFPDALEAARDDAEVASILAGEEDAFRAAATALRNDRAVLERDLEAHASNAKGHEAELASRRQQLAILEQDYADKVYLLNRGLTRRSEVNRLHHAILEANGQIGRLQAKIEEIGQGRLRVESQIDSVAGARRQAALDQLQAAESALARIREESRKAENVLERAEVRAPVAGTVVRLHVHTPGGVIESGEPIAEILPADQPLLVEVHVPRVDIDSVRVGQRAAVRLTALNQRTTPVIDGEVVYVSADAVAQMQDGVYREVYVARVSLAPSELARVPRPAGEAAFAPTPGMPAEVLIRTAERTFAEYLARPIVDSMSHAFREQ